MREFESKGSEIRGNPNWRKGMPSPNPGGESLKLRKLRKLLAKHSLRAAAITAEIMESPAETTADRLKAADIILKYSCPKPTEPTKVDVSVKPGAISSELAARIAALEVQ
jgi:hypothetical protein